MSNCMIRRKEGKQEETTFWCCTKCSSGRGRVWMHASRTFAFFRWKRIGGLLQRVWVYPCETDETCETVWLLQFRREFESGGIRVVEMLFKSNILALVGGGEIPRYPPNKVIMWDDHQGRAIGEIACKGVVRSVKLRRDRIGVALDNKVLVYDLSNLRLVFQTETTANPDGLLALCPSSDSTILACPGLHEGQLRVDMLDTKRVKIIQAHNRKLAAISMTSNGKYIATASEKGTLIRIFSTSDGSKIREVRRGTDPAVVWSIAFSHEDMPHWLAVTSDKGTVHVFDLREDEEDIEEGYQLVENVPSSSKLSIIQVRFGT